MDRLACASIPAFPLQLLLRRRPEWATHPLAVVAEEAPQGLILWANETARRRGVRPGLRYAAALSLATDLRAGVVPPAEIAGGIAALAERLRRFTPDVEPSSEEPGVFWLGVAGLHRLYPSPDRWARAVAADLEREGFRAGVVVGFTRFGTYAVSRIRRGPVVLEDPGRERAAARQVPLDRLPLDPDVRDALEMLGVRTVGALLRLPAGGLLDRFGPGVHRLHRLAAGEPWAPLQPHPAEDPVGGRLALDEPATTLTHLLFCTKRLLHPLLAALEIRGELLAELALRLRLDGTGWREERVRPAAPTRDARQVLDLVRLRLEAEALPAGVIEIEATARGVRAMGEQLELLTERPQRDLAAAHRALARIRAEFGDEAVVRARLTDGHLPEARFAWEPLEQVALPHPREGGPRPLVRRILTAPAPLPPPPGPTQGDPLEWPPGSITRLHGPYVISGEWWRQRTERDYYFAETGGGELLWVYYDRGRRRWHLHGQVE